MSDAASGAKESTAADAEDERTTAEATVDSAAIDADDKPTPAPPSATGRPSYPFPRRTLEDALRIPTALRLHNGGEPWAPADVAKALGVGGRTGSFFYLTTASRDYGLTEGSRDAAEISLTALGRRAVYPTSDQEAAAAKLEAFFNIEKFGEMVRHYKGSRLPDDQFVRNNLETKFGLDPRTHDDFLDVFAKNCRFVGIGAEWNGNAGTITDRVPTAYVNGAATPSAPHAAAPRGDGSMCFVAMPFSERTDEFATGFFTEVFASVFKPAIEAAGFEARTAKRQGSDVIHSTIVNELLDADLVLVDLTEHNPNVLFELGLRIAANKPTVLVKATGTRPIFDVDNMMRVESYNPNLWPSTVKDDVPKLAAHIKQGWDARDTVRSYMDILRAHAGSQMI